MSTPNATNYNLITHVVLYRYDDSGNLLTGYPKIQPGATWFDGVDGRYHKTACYSLAEAQDNVTRSIESNRNRQNVTREDMANLLDKIRNPKSGAAVDAWQGVRGCVSVT